MSAKLDREQRVLCALLAAALRGQKLSGKVRQEFLASDKKKILHMAERHRVLSLLYDVLQGDGLLEEAEKKRLEDVSRQAVRQSYRLAFLTRHLVRILEEEGISSVVLKGSGLAAWYPVPELRRAGDVDLLVGEGEMERALDVLARDGYRLSESQHANHHRVLCSSEGIDIELHSLPAEPFSHEGINARMEELVKVFLERKIYRECMDISLPVPPDACQALQMLLHMLQHFLRSGFGLRLLCDWTVFWRGQKDEAVWESFEELAASCGISRFAEVVTACCGRYLGLDGKFLTAGTRHERGRGANDPETLLTERFLCDIFDSEEFGKAGAERMVAVQGRGVGAYLKEFHYQMKMNHLKASKCVLLWPVLWGITLAVFLRNNRKLQRGSVREILRSAGERGKLREQMGLWEELKK